MKLSNAMYVFQSNFQSKPQKKTSIDGLKWRDLVMGRWWLVKFNVSAVRCLLSAVGCHKGFHVLNSARQASPCKRPRARRQPIPPQSCPTRVHLLVGVGWETQPALSVL